MLRLLVKAALVGLALGSHSHSHHAHLHQRHAEVSQDGYTDLALTQQVSDDARMLNQTSLEASLNRNLLGSRATTKKDKGVFAHFMVENTALWATQNWEADMKMAIEAHLDGFALNFAASLTDLTQLSNAFEAAENKGFKLFLSFDYAGAGAFEKATVISIIEKFSSSSAYYTFEGKPLVSTFEGPANAADWKDIKSETGCFFIPSWSSLGAMEALKLNTPDGLFSWAGWPWGDKDMDTYVDASYLDYLDQAGGKAYMMPVSPWFYTNLPGYDKNWLWRGDDLWRDRWEEVMVVQPDLVQVISWNDYGESHYIGPLRGVTSYEAFDVGEAPFNYATQMPHDGWRLLLPYYIDTYKNGKASITEEGVVGWYRLNPSGACSDGGTTGNTASQLQYEFQPAEVSQDKIFYSAVLTSLATVTVTVGGVSMPATWENIPDGGVGVYHGSVEYGANTGDVTITIARSGSTIAEFTGEAITKTCTDGYTNWNAWVGSASGPSISAVSPELSVDEQACIEGTAPGNFQGLCEFTCQYGYCPIGACVCTKMGAPKTKPKATGDKGYPIAGEGSSYIGLCSFACNYGHCPSSACGSEEVPVTEPTVSPFLPSACTAGTGDGNLEGLCSYACNFGFCPIHACTCTATGALNVPPAANTTFTAVYQGEEDDAGLCKFACQRTYCPDVCSSTEDAVPSCDDDDTSGDCAEDTSDPCDLSLTFDSWEDLEAATDISDLCMPMYAIQVLMDTLNTALDNYTDVDNGYDDKFGYYVEYLRDMVPAAMDSFVSTIEDSPGNKYFECSINEDGTWKVKDCPIITTTQIWIVNYTLIDEDGFYDELQSKYGITKDWIEFTSIVDTHRYCPPRVNNHPKPCTSQRREWRNIPRAKDNFNVPNPKDSIKNALPRFQDLQLDIASTWADLSFFMWDGDDDDAVQALATPVFMLMQSVDSMATVKKIGEEEEEELEKEKRNLILTILSAILMILPFAGEIVGAVTDVAWIADAAALADVTANLALAGYDIVTDPSSAPMELLNILFAGSGRTGENLSKVASVRRGIKAEQLSKFGSVFKENDDVLQSLISFCKK